MQCKLQTALHINICRCRSSNQLLFPQKLFLPSPLRPFLPFAFSLRALTACLLIGGVAGRRAAASAPRTTGYLINPNLREKSENCVGRPPSNGTNRRAHSLSQSSVEFIIRRGKNEGGEPGNIRA